MTGADLIVRVLRQNGVDFIATLCGHGLDPLFGAARRAGMRFVDTRNEQTASYVADAYGRLTGRVGVCAVSSGIAHVNALSGVANAWFDHAPMLLISGAASTETAGKGHFQEMDQPALAAGLCKVSRHVSRAEEIAGTIREALEAALTLPYGPVHLTVPMDVQNAVVADADVRVRVRQPARVPVELRGASKPVVVAGSGVFYSGAAEEMLAFCERYWIPVVTPIWDRGAVKRPSKVFAGVVGAATGGAAILEDSDCVLLAGVESDYRVGYLEQSGAHYNWGEIDVQPFDGWLEECIARRDRFREAVQQRGREQARAGMHAIDVIAAIESVLPLDPVLLIDGGSIGQWAHQLLCADRYPPDWLTCGRSAVVGWGLGGAMAARMAYPKRPVLLLSGDGAFTFNLAEIEAAARQGLHFVALVADDQGWGITRTGHVRQFGEAISSSLGPIAFDRVAEALGARGVRASTPDALKEELRHALEQQAVTVIHAPIVGGNPA